MPKVSKADQFLKEFKTQIKEADTQLNMTQHWSRPRGSVSTPRTSQPYSAAANRPSEEEERIKENNDVKVSNQMPLFIITVMVAMANTIDLPYQVERTRTNFFAVTWQKLQCCNPIKYSNRTALDNDLRIVAAAMNHRVPSAGDVLEKIIEDFKAKSTKSVQNDNAHHTYSDPLTPYYGTHMYHRTRLPYMGHTTLSPGPQSPFWHSSTGNVNYRSRNLSSVRNRFPHFYSEPRGGHCPKPQQTHHSNKRLRYDPGREHRESLKVVTESKKTSTVGSDDETQDDSLTESPVPKKSNTGAEASVASMVENNGESVLE
ncbi:hypothetical protein ACROYT_G015449 [Oculina patagonica]